MRSELEPDVLLPAYAIGIFPMADDEGEIHWLAPDPRAIIEPNAFKTTRSLRAAMRRGEFTITVDNAFERVIAACADRPEGTWISRDIHDAYCELHRRGFAHSVETWAEGELVGGLYGVTIGGAFFGESMFHRATDASKVALVELVERMRKRGYVLLDVQFLTEHLERFGAVEIPRSEYQQRLARAIMLPCSFVDPPGESSEEDT
jgi:leucyl/phenylalanyl-tRNA--protein transferase